MSDKVHCQEGNSPDYMLRFLNFVNDKELSKNYILKGRLRIGHPLKKS